MYSIMKAKIFLSSPKKHIEAHESFLDELSRAFEIESDLERLGMDSSSTCLCFGGDGSLNYLIESLFKKKNVPGVEIIYFPMGTANDFAKSLKITAATPPTLEKIKSIMDSQYLVSIPVMQCNDRHFINVASVGLPAMITESRESFFKELSGPVSYYLSALKQFFTEKTFNVSYQRNGSPEIARKTFGFFVSQGLYAGGGIKVSAGYSPNFGDNFNFLIPESEEKIDIVIAATEVQKESPDISEFHLTSEPLKDLIVRCDEELPVKLDGEVYSSKELHFRKSRKTVKFYLHGQDF